MADQNSDVIERLRAFDSDEHPLAHEAADEIERLRTGGDVSDSQMRAMIDQACEDLGRHGLQPTDEAAQVVLNLIASASGLGRLVDLRNEPSAVEALEEIAVDRQSMTDARFCRWCGRYLPEHEGDCPTSIALNHSTEQD